MRRNTIAVAAAALAAAGVVGVAGAAIAADSSTATPNPSTSTSTAPPDGGAGRGASQDTAVTGSEADKVIAAVKAKDSSASITTVRKDPDGSYDAIGTKAGSPVFYDVSKDLKTVTASAGRAGGGHGGGPGGGSQDTAVTGSEADKVIAAVKAKDSSASITTVRKDPDGSYDAIGTKAGSPVFYDVSKDLKTVTASAGRAGGGHGGPSGGSATSGTTGTLPGSSSGTSTTSSDPTAANTGYTV